MCSFVDVPINFDSLEKAENEGRFMAETVNLSNEVIHNVALLSGSRESEELLSRKEAIICGLLIRITKLFQSFAKLVTQRDSVGATFLYRGITDCIIDMEFLIKRDDDDLFDEFVQHGLYAEVEKMNTIEERIQDREAMPIEKRILSGIERDILRSGYSVQEVKAFPPKKNNRWKNLNSLDKIKALGYEDMYLFSQITGNNLIHSNWPTLLSQHLTYDEGKYVPKYENMPVHPQMLLTVQTLICRGALRYISYMYSSEELKEYLSKVFKQTLDKVAKLDRLHEAYLVRKMERT